MQMLESRFKNWVDMTFSTLNSLKKYRADVELALPIYPGRDERELVDAHYHLITLIKKKIQEETKRLESLPRLTREEWETGQDNMILAIKMVRERIPGIGLVEAKEVAVHGVVTQVFL